MASAVSAKRSSPARGKQNARSHSPDPSVLLTALQEDVKDIRCLIQCGICVKLLYEPFTLACGHTFCYSCLTQWFENSRRRKTCPDCRAVVTAQPAPAYLVRQVVQMFTNREELFEKYETAVDHRLSQRAETERMEVDKSNTDVREGGLFRGCFNRIAPAGEPIHDVDDGVERCPDCAWELESGECYHCGFTGGHTDSDSNEFDEFDEMDEFGTEFWGDYGSNDEIGDVALNQIVNRNRVTTHPWFRAGRLGVPGSMESDEDSWEDETDDGEMASFISDDNHEDEHGTDRSTMLEDRSFMPHEIDHTSDLERSMHDAGNPIEVDDSVEEVQASSDDEDNDVPSRPARVRYRVASSSPAPSKSSAASSSSNDDFDDPSLPEGFPLNLNPCPFSSEDDGSVSHSRNPYPVLSSEDGGSVSRNRNPYPLSSEDEGTISHDQTQDDTGSVGTSTTNAIPVDDDEDEDEEGPIRPARVERIRARRRRRQENRRIRRSQELRRGSR